jgi:hypothetical protein
VCTNGATATTGSAAGAEGEADDAAELRPPERERHRREREHGVRQDERREAQSEQDAVEARRERKRQRSSPVLRHLPADLRRDRGAAGLGERSGDRDDRRGDEQVGAEAADRATGGRGEPERRDPSRESPEREGGARLRHAPPRAADRLDHRETARRPRPRQPGDRGDAGERDRQHGIFVS